MLGRADLDGADLERAVDVLDGYLDDDSQIVRVNAMTALADLAAEHPRLRDPVVERIEALVEDGSPSVRARGAKLLEALEALD